MADFDALIENGTIVDGSGRDAYRGNVAIKGDKVAAVGSVKGDAKEVIDASGLTVIPRIIDAHSHADTNLLFVPSCENYILMGCTTFVGGQCGISPAPVGDLMPLPGRARQFIGELTPYKYYPERSLFPREQVNELMEEHYGWTVEWETMGDFFGVVEERGFSANYVPLVGHGAVRQQVMGEDFKRHATEPEQAEMTMAIQQAMEDGCIGLSVGLDYDPDVWASREELVEHVSVIRDYGGIFVPHSRRTGRRRGVTVGQARHNKIDGINEVIEICRAAEVRMNIAHIFTGWYITPSGHPYILEEANRKATLEIIDKAREGGLDITFDAMPASLSSPYGGSNYLSSLLAPWLRELGSREEFSKRLREREFREEVKADIMEGKWFLRMGYNPNTNPRWAHNIMVLKHAKPECEDKSVAEIAEERGADEFETWLDLIAEDPEARCPIGEWYAPLDPNAPYHTTFYQHPLSAVGLDTGVVDYSYESKVPPWSTAGIVQFSAFVGFFDKYVNREKVFTVEEAVRKTSTQAARNYGIEGRGAIMEGCYADIVLMDLPNLRVMGTPLESRQPPRGIEYVFVNGEAVVRNARHTGARPGRVLRRG